MKPLPGLLLFAAVAVVGITIFKAQQPEPITTAEHPPPEVARSLEELAPATASAAAPDARPAEITVEVYATSTDVGGITLAELFEDALSTIDKAHRTLTIPLCLEPSFQSAAEACAPEALYEAALLFDYCRGGPPPEAFPPSRLEEQFGVTDVAQLRRAEEEQKLQAVQRDIIQRECAKLTGDLLALPRLLDTSTATDTDPHAEGLAKHQRNGFAYRLHAALLGERRAGRWIVQDWLAMPNGYLDELEVGKVVRSFAGTAEGHRLAYQWEVHRSPSIDCCDGYDDEDRRIAAAAHLIAYRSLEPGYYEEPADTRWMRLHEGDFMAGLDQNEISLARDQAYRLLHD